MKSLSKLIALPLTIAAFLFAGSAAKADPYNLTIALDSGFQSGVAGSTLTFSGVITNITGGAVNFTGDSFTLAGVSANDTDFWLNTPLSNSFAPGATSDIGLFTITILPGTPSGIYVETFDIMNGNTVEGTVTFDIDVTPEPGTWLLLGTGLLLLAALIRFRLPKTQTLTAA
jgi:hypothetical protein